MADRVSRSYALLSCELEIYKASHRKSSWDLRQNPITGGRGKALKVGMVPLRSSHSINLPGSKNRVALVMRILQKELWIGSHLPAAIKHVRK